MYDSKALLKNLTVHPQWEEAKKACLRLEASGFDAVLAGGCVRDSLLGRKMNDIDIATDATPDEIESVFRDLSPVLVGKKYGVIILPIPNKASLEIASFRTDGEYLDGRHPEKIKLASLKEDALRRDFTINALYFRPRTQEVLDFTNGIGDLNRRLIRAVGDPQKRFKEDALRVLRAVRFLGQLDFEIEENTKKAISLKVLEIKKVSLNGAGEWVSRERIRDELDKMLLSEKSERSFEVLSELSLSNLVFDDWTSRILPLPPEHKMAQSLMAKRFILFQKIAQEQDADHIEQRLLKWKYSREFIDLIRWYCRNQNALRSSSDDPVHKLQSSKEFLDNPTDFLSDLAVTSDETSWGDLLENWTDPKAPTVVEALDSLMGEDIRRVQALKRRGLTLGVKPLRIKSDILQQIGLQGPELGEALRKLQRFALLKVKFDS